MGTVINLDDKLCIVLLHQTRRQRNKQSHIEREIQNER